MTNAADIIADAYQLLGAFAADLPQPQYDDPRLELAMDMLIQAQAALPQQTY